MMSPSEYASHYKNLPVTRIGDTQSTTVALKSYRLRSLNYQQSAATAFFNAVRKGVDVTMTVTPVDGPPTRVRVSDSLTQSEKRFEKAIQKAYKLPNDKADTLQITIEPPAGQAGTTQVTTMFINEIVRGPFSGKGSPEACQIVLQLANHFGLAPDMQQYATRNLGLDCNGFVGNYLWHIKGGRSWTNLGMGNWDLGPDAHITEFFRVKQFLTKWTDFNPHRLHLLGMVDATGQIIKGGPNSRAGHIGITDPDWPATGQMMVVESTGAEWVGLTESLYSLRGTRTLGGKVVFDVDRSVKMGGHQFLTFAIAPL
jgi:hypothetical protein